MSIEDNALKLVKDYLTDQNQLKLLISAVKIQLDKQNELKKQVIVNIAKQKERLFNQYEKGQISSHELKIVLGKLVNQSYQSNQFELTDKELETRLRELLQLSNAQSQEMIWTYINEVILDKEKNIQEVIIYGIRIQSSRT